MSDLEGEDWRNEETRKLDLMIDQVADLAKSVRELTEKVPAVGGPTQRLIYRHEGMGSVGILCVAVAVLCVLFVIVESGRQESAISRAGEKIEGEITRAEARVDGRLRDLEAWRGLHSTKIQNLESQVAKEKAK